MSAIASATQTSTAQPTGGGPVDAGVKAWIDALNDDSGAISAADKASALGNIQKSWGTLSSASQATKDYVNAGLNSSSFLAKSNALGMAMNTQIADITSPAKATSPKSSAVFQKMLDYYDGLSADDKIQFGAGVGANGDDWRATTAARLKLANLFETAQSHGEMGADGKPTGKADGTLKMLIDISNQFDRLDKTKTDQVNAWTRQVGALLHGGRQEPAVRIDLSDDAKTFLAGRR